MINEFLWVEKYRPKTVEECILPKDMKATFESFVARKELPNLMLCGSAGVGKTTVAKALCNEIGADYIFINGSDESGIDVLRGKIHKFASTVSFSENAKKVVILDEADYLNPNSFQPALRGFIEEFSNNCTFIFTCNFKNRIISPLHSRCSVIDFKIDSAEKPRIMKLFYKRIIEILERENITYDTESLAKFIAKHFPDYRRMLNELQRYASSGTIDSGVLLNLGDESYNELIKAMKAKHFTDVRKWVGKNSDIDPSEIFRTLYERCFDFLEPASIPQMILIIADYQYKNAFVADREINTMAAMTEIMSQVRFK